MIADIVQTGLTSWWAFALAFAAGVVSFASPCVFPLVPGYLSFVTGERAEGDRGIGSMLLFVAGLHGGVRRRVFGFTDVFLPGRPRHRGQDRDRDRDRAVRDAAAAVCLRARTDRAVRRAPAVPGQGGRRGRLGAGVGLPPRHGLRGRLDPLHRAGPRGDHGARGRPGERPAGGLPAGHVLARARAPVRPGRTGREAIHGRVRLHPAQLPVDRGRLRRADGRDRRAGRDGAVGSPARAACCR